MTTTYVHGYTEPEARRLGDQADTLAALLHAGTAYPAGSRVLEVGCGVGAQTGHLVARSPGAHLTAVDVSADSLAQARQRVPGVDFRRADLFDLDGEWDHLFVCFVLEHLPEPGKALAHLITLLRPGGTITVHRRRPRLGVLPPAQRARPGGDRLPGAPAGRRGR